MAFSDIFKSYFSLYASYPELVRKHSDTIIGIVRKYLDQKQESTKQVKEEIELGLKTIISTLEYREKEIGTGYAEKLLSTMKKLERK